MRAFIIYLLVTLLFYQTHSVSIQQAQRAQQSLYSDSSNTVLFSSLQPLYDFQKALYDAVRTVTNTGNTAEENEIYHSTESLQSQGLDVGSSSALVNLAQFQQYAMQSLLGLKEVMTESYTIVSGGVSQLMSGTFDGVSPKNQNMGLSSRLRHQPASIFSTTAGGTDDADSRSQHDFSSTLQSILPSFEELFHIFPFLQPAQYHTAFTNSDSQPMGMTPLVVDPTLYHSVSQLLQSSNYPHNQASTPEDKLPSLRKPTFLELTMLASGISHLPSKAFSNNVHAMKDSYFTSDSDGISPLTSDSSSSQLPSTASIPPQRDLRLPTLSESAIHLLLRQASFVLQSHLDAAYARHLAPNVSNTQSVVHRISTLLSSASSSKLSPSIRIISTSQLDSLYDRDEYTVEQIILRPSRKQSNSPRSNRKETEGDSHTPPPSSSSHGSRQFYFVINNPLMRPISVHLRQAMLELAQGLSSLLPTLHTDLQALIQSDLDHHQRLIEMQFDEVQSLYPSSTLASIAREQIALTHTLRAYMSVFNMVTPSAAEAKAIHSLNKRMRVLTSLLTSVYVTHDEQVILPITINESLLQRVFTALPDIKRAGAIGPAYTPHSPLVSGAQQAASIALSWAPSQSPPSSSLSLDSSSPEVMSTTTKTITNHDLIRLVSNEVDSVQLSHHKVHPLSLRDRYITSHPLRPLQEDGDDEDGDGGDDDDEPIDIDTLIDCGTGLARNATKTTYYVNNLPVSEEEYNNTPDDDPEMVKRMEVLWLLICVCPYDVYGLHCEHRQQIISNSTLNKVVNTTDPQGYWYYHQSELSPPTECTPFNYLDVDTLVQSLAANDESGDLLQGYNRAVDYLKIQPYLSGQPPCYGLSYGQPLELEYTTHITFYSKPVQGVHPSIYNLLQLDGYTWDTNYGFRYLIFRPADAEDPRAQVDYRDQRDAIPPLYAVSIVHSKFDDNDDEENQTDQQPGDDPQPVPPSRSGLREKDYALTSYAFSYSTSSLSLYLHQYQELSQLIPRLTATASMAEILQEALPNNTTIPVSRINQVDPITTRAIFILRHNDGSDIPDISPDVTKDYDAVSIAFPRTSEGGLHRFGISLRPWGPAAGSFVPVTPTANAVNLNYIYPPARSTGLTNTAIVIIICVSIVVGVLLLLAIHFFLQYREKHLLNQEKKAADDEYINEIVHTKEEKRMAVIERRRST